MATFVFVLLFVLLGLGVLFTAMSGGPGGARQRLQSQSRGSRKLAVAAFLLSLLVLGFGIPAVVIALVDDRSDVPDSNISNLTAMEKQGRELFGNRCAACHTLKASNAVAQVGPNLDQLRPPKALVLDAIAKGRANGNGQMAAQIYTGEDAQAVAAYVAKAAGPGGSGT